MEFAEGERVLVEMPEWNGTYEATYLGYAQCGNGCWCWPLKMCGYMIKFDWFDTPVACTIDQVSSL